MGDLHEELARMSKLRAVYAQVRLLQTSLAFTGLSLAFTAPSLACYGLL